jgi:hypothetical protein
VRDAYALILTDISEPSGTSMDDDEFTETFLLNDRPKLFDVLGSCRGRRTGRLFQEMTVERLAEYVK